MQNFLTFAASIKFNFTENEKTHIRRDSPALS